VALVCAQLQEEHTNDTETPYIKNPYQKENFEEDSECTVLKIF
jgi:hypothetical protein